MPHEMVPFKYGYFYDVPRCVTLHYRGRHVLLLSAFDEQLDDYASAYAVYLLHASSKELVPCSPDFLCSPMTRIGQVPIRDVTFDESKRAEIDAAILDDLFNEISDYLDEPQS